MFVVHGRVFCILFDDSKSMSGKLRSSSEIMEIISGGIRSSVLWFRRRMICRFA